MLLWIEGFEGMGVTDNAAPAPSGILSRKYPSVSGSGYKLQAGRTGGHALELPYAVVITFPGLGTTNATLVAGFGFKSTPLVNYRIFEMLDGVTEGINLRMTSGGELEIYRGSTFLKTTSGLGLLSATWYWIEMKVFCDDAVGTYEVRIGGVNVLSGTGDTKVGTHAYHDSAVILNYISGALTQYDDIYILDGSGSVNNDFLGNMKVVAIAPNADVSGAEEFTPSSAVDHYTLVDENPVTDDTDYVEDDTTDHRDLWEYGSVSSLGAIAGLQINTMVRETDATSFDLKTPVQSNGVDSDGTGQTVGSTNYKTLRRIVETDPDTGVVWTMDGINAARFGVKVG